MIMQSTDKSTVIRALRSAAPYIRLYKGKTFVVKAGGAVFGDAVATRALIEGSVLVAVVLLLFLGELRSALVVIVALPLAMLIAFIGMRQFGLSANLMSLAGLAIGIGASTSDNEDVNRVFAPMGLSVGIGIAPPMASLGTMCNDATEALRTNPYQLFLPAIAICVIMFAFNFVGDGLRDALDPKLKK